VSSRPNELPIEQEAEEQDEQEAKRLDDTPQRAKQPSTNMNGFGASVAASGMPNSPPTKTSGQFRSPTAFGRSRSPPPPATFGASSFGEFGLSTNPNAGTDDQHPFDQSPARPLKSSKLSAGQHFPGFGTTAKELQDRNRE
jgi:hypothetical protein